MIRYQLQCGGGHAFEAWFRSSADYDDQSEKGALRCPVCDGPDVKKAIMAPAIARRGERRADHQAGSAGTRLSAEKQAIAEKLSEAAKRARDYVEKNFDYVGTRFPEEARRIHYGETKEQRIYGEATRAEAKELIEEGIAVAPLPDPKAVGHSPAAKKKLN